MHKISIVSKVNKYRHIITQNMHLTQFYPEHSQYKLIFRRKMVSLNTLKKTYAKTRGASGRRVVGC